MAPQAAGQGGAAPAASPTAATVSKKRIAGIVMQEDQFMRLAELGMRSAAKDGGAELLLGNSFGAQDKEFALVDNYIQGKVDAIVVDALSATASIPALKRAYDQGIKVVTWDGGIKADFPAAAIRSDHEALGRATGEVAADYVAKQLGGRANVAMIEYISLSPEVGGARVKGFKDSLTSATGVKIVAEQDAWLAPQAADKVEGILTSHPEVNVIWAANEGGTVGAVRAVRNSGNSGKVFVFGTDMSAEIADLLLSSDNILQAVTGQKPYEIGVKAVQAALAVTSGQPVEKKIVLPGTVFTRQKPDEVRKYKAYLEQVSR